MQSADSLANGGYCMDATGPCDGMAPAGKARHSLGGALPKTQRFTIRECINWREVILDLNRAGLNDTVIAARVGSNHSTIGAYKNEDRTEPKYSLGARLLTLHARTVKQ